MKKLVFCLALILAMFSSPSIDYAEARGGGGGGGGRGVASSSARASSAASHSTATNAALLAATAGGAAAVSSSSNRAEVSEKPSNGAETESGIGFVLPIIIVGVAAILIAGALNSK